MLCIEGQRMNPSMTLCVAQLKRSTDYGVDYLLRIASPPTGCSFPFPKHTDICCESRNSWWKMYRANTTLAPRQTDVTLKARFSLLWWAHENLWMHDNRFISIYKEISSLGSGQIDTAGINWSFLSTVMRNPSRCSWSTQGRWKQS